MALRHAVLAALLHGERSGYELAKTFDVGVADFWYAAPQQLYLEIAKLEREGMLAGREVVQTSRPNKRVYRVTGAGLAELARFAEAPTKPIFGRDELLVKVHAADHLDPAPLLEQLAERAAIATAKIALFTRTLQRLRGELSQEQYLADGDQVGPYLTCLRGLRFEQENLDWCGQAAQVLRSRAEVRDPEPRTFHPQPHNHRKR